MSVKIGVCAALVLLMLVAPQVESEQIALTDGVIRSISDPFVENIITGLQQPNYAQFVVGFSPPLLLQYPPASFPALTNSFHETYGGLTGVDYLGFLRRDAYTTVFYRLQSPKHRMEFLLRVNLTRLTQTDGTRRASVYFVTAFHFESPASVISLPPN